MKKILLTTLILALLLIPLGTASASPNLQNPCSLTVEIHQIEILIEMGDTIFYPGLDIRAWLSSTEASDVYPSNVSSVPSNPGDTIDIDEDVNRNLRISFVPDDREEYKIAIVVREIDEWRPLGLDVVSLGEALAPVIGTAVGGASVGTLVDGIIEEISPSDETVAVHTLTLIREEGYNLTTEPTTIVSEDGGANITYSVLLTGDNCDISIPAAVPPRTASNPAPVLVTAMGVADVPTFTCMGTIFQARTGEENALPAETEVEVLGWTLDGANNPFVLIEDNPESPQVWLRANMVLITPNWADFFDGTTPCRES